ncbi:Ferric uptake regulation protein [Clostridiaceae bacterium BL-3]|nr:Ferric uptake regulation protein [Clostridiaceae bacterium BL-3]
MGVLKFKLKWGIVMSKLSSSEIERLKNSLKEKGYKLTPQRRAIVDIIIRNEGQHLTTEEIYDQVRSECPEIGLATVYRTVQLLDEIGVICKLDLDDGCNRYEIIHKEENHQHHHLICNKCSKIIEVTDDLLEPLEREIEKKYDFKILNHSLKFYGICSDCKKSGKYK